MFISQKNLKNVFLLLIFTLFSFLLLESSNIYAQSTSISASVRIAICGNSDVEWGEDCEPTTFNQMFCSQLGYEGGQIYCENSCSYDLYECVIPEPPPPTEEEIIVKEIEDLIKKKEPIIIVSPTLPFLKLFDLDKNGVIDRYEFVQSVTLWGEYWREYQYQENISGIPSCDLNNDSVCDIVDLSILLYHTK